MNIWIVHKKIGILALYSIRYFFGPIGRFLYNLYKNIEHDDCIGLATRMAYSALFSLVPLLIVLITTLGFFGLSDQTINKIVDLILVNIPGPIVNLVENNIVTIFSVPQKKLFSIGLVFTIWGSTNVLSVAYMGINKIFRGKDTRPFYKRRLIAFLFILCIGILTGTIYIFIHTLSPIFEHFKIENYVSNFITSWDWPISLFTIFMLSATIYYLAPSLKIPFYSAIPGALFFTGLWNFLTLSFTFYINKLGNFSAVYGTLTTAVILMIWFYLAGLIFMIGGEINYLFFIRIARKGVDSNTRKFT